ncbi:hypothetical protein TRIUR3_20109 [Triticum urartu]|uniref:Uncharacterized protein n=1 Tax=Triticum urartu TaxID=4572 RepID=M7ZVR4_TRIUA|nr:uncharacterized protein LOC119317595 [Triticum dicoccoides]XP_048535572.1 uncharacterized protein LOC125514303 [Triticum urartu]EMS56470.1 hypothetical protein TRIUR3_20109 [Triticum urartu]
MASMTQPMPYYPTTNPIMHAQPATTSRGSFAPVFTVLGVISFLAVVACVAGRLCGRRLSKKKAYADQHYYGTNAVGGDLEKGFEVKYPPMKPMPSSRAVVHDMDDGFEIKFAPGKPAAWKTDAKADNRGRPQQQHHHHQHPQAGMPKEYAGFRYPAAANGAVRQGQVRGGTFVSAKPGS